MGRFENSRAEGSDLLSNGAPSGRFPVASGIAIGRANSTKWATACGLLLLAAWLATPAAFGGLIHVGASQTYTTIQDGYAAASSGDVILIDDGSYNLPSTLNVAKSVTFQAVNIGGAHVSGGGFGSDDAIFFLSADSKFDGLFLSGANSGHGIYQRDTGANGVITHSIFYGIQYALSINNSGSTSGSLDISHSTIVNSLNAVNINDGGTVRIRNSILYHVTGAYIATNDIAILPDHNLLFGVTDVVGGTGFVGSDPAQFIGDPLFVNAAAQDFRLQAGSPAIDSGINLGNPFLGLAPDRGAFEYSPSNPVPVPSGIVLLGLGMACAGGGQWWNRIRSLSLSRS